MQGRMETITLGGGCFWCTEAVFVRVRGVLDVESGYCNGHVPNVTYQQVCTGTTGHAEVVQLVYDPSVITLQDVLEIFFLIHDPTQLNRQGADVGTQYRSGIYCSDAAQLAAVQAFVEALRRSGSYDQPVVTEVVMRANYVPAEAYHQDFFERNPTQGYCMAVAAPKVAKFRKTFARFARD